MYEQVIFYNHFGAGDIFESRNFIKAWMKLVPAKNYFYSHGKHPRILKDIKRLNFKEITQHMDARRGVWDDLNGNLYVNTWIGRDGSYVLPGIGCTVEKLYQMHNDLLSVYGLGKLPGEPIDYIPLIDYQMYKVDGINKFIKDNSHPEKIFIDNGLVQSAQARNFDFNPIIMRLAETYRNKMFIVTHQFSHSIPNIHYTGDIIGEKLGFDLNEVSYLSIFCTTLIGRNSGPHVYTQCRGNCFEDWKRLVSFTHRPEGASFVVNTQLPIKKYWFSSDSSEAIIAQEIERIIE